MPARPGRDVRGVEPKGYGSGGCATVTAVAHGVTAAQPAARHAETRWAPSAIRSAIRTRRRAADAAGVFRFHGAGPRQATGGRVARARDAGRVGRRPRPGLARRLAGRGSGAPARAARLARAAAPARSRPARLGARTAAA